MMAAEKLSLREVVEESVILTPITSNMIEDIWPLIEGLVVRALASDPNAMPLDDVKDALEKAHMQLWVAMLARTQPVGLYLTEVLESGTVRVLYACGDLGRLWIAQGQIIDDWARSIGARSIEVVGRKGWAKVLEPDGFQEVARIWSKPLC